MLVFSHADCLLHDPGVGHPESPARLRAAWDAIAALNIPMQDAPFAPETALRLAHDAGYVQQIMQLRDRIDTVRVDADTVVGMGSVDAFRAHQARLLRGSPARPPRHIRHCHGLLPI
jgi:acetoin utilization deacetylase AcuC-like enzyme